MFRYVLVTASVLCVGAVAAMVAAAMFRYELLVLAQYWVTWTQVRAQRQRKNDNQQQQQPWHQHEVSVHRILRAAESLSW
jgi:hypothetical protein